MPCSCSLVRRRPEPIGRPVRSPGRASRPPGSYREHQRETVSSRTPRMAAISTTAYPSCQPTTHRAVGSVFCPPPHQPQECRAEPPFPARVGGGSVPPPPAGGIALQCSTAPVVLPRSRRFSRRFAGCSVGPPASARRRPQLGERESMGAQVPRAAFASTSERRDALSVRGDTNCAMRCRKKPRDALSVRTLETISEPSRHSERIHDVHRCTSGGAALGRTRKPCASGEGHP